jgi:hypothetical protein
MPRAIPVTPEAVGAERGVLGAILTDPTRFLDVANCLAPDDFALSSHRAIYRCMCALAAQDKPIDLVLLCENLNAAGELERVGGIGYITTLLDGCIPESVRHYADLVRTAARKRRFLNALELAKSGILDGLALGAVMARLRDSFNDADDPAGDTLGHSHDELVNAPPLTFAIDGFLPENGVTIIGGLSGHGKTLIMLAMTRALLEGGKLFDYFPANATSKVIYLIPECGLGPFRHRLEIFRLMDYVREGRLVVRTLGRKPISLDDPRLLHAARGADIFLDTVTRFKSGDENDAGENSQFAEDLFSLQRAGARSITGAHHSPKSFGRDTFMSLENILRGTGDIGAMLATCWGIRQVDVERNRIYVQNVKARDYQPCEPFVIQGRPSLDQRGYFELTDSPGCAGELSEYVSKERGGRPAVSEDKKGHALRLHGEGMSQRQIANAVGVSVGSVNKWIHADTR